MAVFDRAMEPDMPMREQLVAAKAIRDRVGFVDGSADREDIQNLSYDDLKRLVDDLKRRQSNAAKTVYAGQGSPGRDSPGHDATENPVIIENDVDILK
jgi:hypothetical protein